MLGEFADRGLIALKRGKIQMLDLDGLKALSDNDAAISAIRTAD